MIQDAIFGYHEGVVDKVIQRSPRTAPDGGAAAGSYDASARRFARATAVLAGGVSSSFRAQVTPVLSFERGAGPYLYDADGHELLDYTLAWGLLIAGSCHPHINAAVREQLERSYAVGAGHESEVRLAERLTALLPGVDLVTFASSGSEIVQVALRLARAATGRDKILKFEGHYHGWINNVLVSHHPEAADVGAPRPVPALAAGQPAAEYADTLVAPWNDLDALQEVFAQHGEQIAGVITEPLLANSGCCEPRPGYLAGLLEVAQAHGALVIFDEVITGFRLALGGAREYYGLTPDLSVYAKAIAAGFPLAAVAGSAAAFAPLLDGRTVHSGSNNGSPVAVAAALATLEILSEPDTYGAMHAHGHAIRRHLEQEARRRGVGLVTGGAGSVFSVHFGLREPPRCYADTLAADADAYARFRAALLEQGIYLLPDGRWYVGATHTDRELQRTLPAITAARTTSPESAPHDTCRDARRHPLASSATAAAAGRRLNGEQMLRRLRWSVAVKMEQSMYSAAPEPRSGVMPTRRQVPESPTRGVAEPARASHAVVDRRGAHGQHCAGTVTP